MYQALTNRAESDGLFALGYLEMRAAHGYDEAGLALDALAANRAAESQTVYA